MGDVVNIGGVTRLDLPHFASSYADGMEVLWLLESCKRTLMNVKGG